MNIIQSPNPAVDTMKCPKCGVIWRSLLVYDEHLEAEVHEEDNCPNECRNFFGFPVFGKVIPREKS